MPQKPPPPPTPPPPREPGGVTPLDVIYRIERQWRKLGAGTCLLGAVCIDYRATGGVLMFISVLCQLISWRAMSIAQRAYAAGAQKASE